MNVKPSQSASQPGSESVILRFPAETDRNPPDNVTSKKAHQKRTKSAPNPDQLTADKRPKKTAKGEVYRAGVLIKFRCRYRGRNWPLYRRGEMTAEDPFTVMIRHRGQRRQLGTNRCDAGGAEAQAKLLIDAVLDNQPDELARLMLHRPPDELARLMLHRPQPGKLLLQGASAIAEPGLALVGQICNHYEVTKGCPGKPRTKTGNAQALRNIIRRGTSRAIAPKTATKKEREAWDAEVQGLSSNVFCKQTAQVFWNQMREDIAACDDDEEAGSVQRNYVSFVRQGLSVLQECCRASYERAGFRLADSEVDAFLRAMKAERPKGKALRVEYHPPEQAMIDRTLHEWVKIAHRNMFLTIGLELAFGLRAGEVPKITWGMFRLEGGRARLNAKVNVKNKSGYIEVDALDPFWTVMCRRIEKMGWRGRDDEPIVNCTKHEYELVSEGISAWMRHGVGLVGPCPIHWETKKTNHALRAYSGSMIALKMPGRIYDASEWLRHSTVTLTERHYSHFCKVRRNDPRRVLVRYSKRMLKVS